MAERMDRGVLWARALVVGALTTFLGVAGHVSADGLLPGWGLLAFLGTFMVLLSLPLLHRPASRLRLVALLTGGQTFIHLVLSVSAGHRGDPAAPFAAVSRAGAPATLPLVDGHRLGSLLDAYSGGAGQPAPAPALPVGHLLDDLAAHGPMMAAHLAAAALVGLWLAHGERCLWSVLALTGRRVLASSWSLAPVPAPLPARRSPAAHHLVPGPAWPWLVRTCSRRGPPVLAV